MAYQTSDITTLVQKRIRDTGFDSTEIVGYLNDTQNDVFNEYRLPFMEAVQDYTVDINNSDISGGDGLPTDYTQAIDLLYTQDGQERLIPYKDIREIDSLHADADDITAHTPAAPQCWYFYAQTIRVYPAPDTAYTVKLRYYKSPTLLVSGDDVPSIPARYQELLVVGAAYRCLQVKDNYDQAGILENKYQELLQKLAVQTSQNQVGTPIQIPINRIPLGKRSF